MKDKMYFILYLIIILQLSVGHGFNYCNNVERCPHKKKPHFLCTLENELPPYLGTTKYLASLPYTKSMKKLLIDKHNTFRNLCAEGKLVAHNGMPYKPAARMRDLIWDDELAYMSRRHADLVCYKHSQCRSTERFPMAGENLGFYMNGRKVGMDQVVNATIGQMFDEYLLSSDPQAMTNNYDPVKYHGTGHFTQIVSDRTSRVGCGISMGNHCSSDPKYICYFLTCQYDFTNLQGSYVFVEGEPASKCADWKTEQHEDYKHLCKNTGEIFETKV